VRLQWRQEIIKRNNKQHLLTQLAVAEEELKWVQIKEAALLLFHKCLAILVAQTLLLLRTLVIAHKVLPTHNTTRPQ
jgi:hypothetical protein